MTSTSYTVAAWAVILVAGGAYYLKSHPEVLDKISITNSASDGSSSTKSRNRRRSKRGAADQPTHQSVTSDLADVLSSATGVEATKGAGKKRKINNAPAAREEPKTNGNAPSSNNDDEGVSNKDFASQMAQARSGTAFAPSAQPGKNKKANLRPVASPDLSSTTGADADDDMSPEASPQIRPSNGGGVADMLEAGPGPAGVLRITGDAPAPKGSKKPAQQVQAEETQKQRQRRRKQEEQKARNEEAEKLRVQLRDQQMRAARMASGTSNQQKANAFNNTQQNAWTAVGKDNKENNNASQVNPAIYEPLDTFDEKPSNGGVGPQGASGLVEKTLNAVKNASAEPEKRSPWADNVPSEEEQLRQLQQQELDSSWSTVGSKKKKGKFGSERDSSEASGTEMPARINAAPMSAAPSHPPPTNQALRPRVNESNSFGAFKDSDWQA